MRHGKITAILLGLIPLIAGQVIRGVNLGGWFVTEQWITPALFASTGTADEWSLCNALGKSSCEKQLRQHWSSFFGRDDFVAIKKAGLNAVRIPVGYWAVDAQDDEPYVSGQYPYLIQAVDWASEVGLQIMLDLHGAPGSQNGQDNSGLIGPVLFPMNSSNADRSLNVLRNLTEEFSQEIYRGAVTGIELLNEPRLSDAHFPMSQLKSFYTDGAATIRSVSDHGINVTIHDTFYGPAYWINYNLASKSADSPATDVTIDTHQYYAFAPLANLTHNEILDHICGISQLLKQPQASTGIPPTVVSEWSLQTGDTSSSTPYLSDANTDDQARRTWFRLLFEAQNAAYTPNGAGQSSIGWYYWTWKTEYDINTWSYRRGIRDGYIPMDVSNTSTYAFPVLDNGCVDASPIHTAPLHAHSGARAIDVKIWPIVAGLMFSVFYARS